MICGMNLDRSKIFSRKPPRSLESGIALISVLWVLLLLSALASTSVYVSRTNAILIHRSLELPQAQGAADAAIVDAISKLSDEQALRHGPIDGIGNPWKFEGIDVVVSISNEASRIDVNAAEDNLILAFLESQGVTRDQSETLIRDLRTWQGMDSAAHHDSNAANVDGQGFANSPGIRPLRAVEELRQIPSWNMQNLDCWFGALTVYSALPGISVVDATPKVLDALKWAQAHRLGNREWMPLSPASTGPSGPKSAIGEVLRIDARANTSTDIHAASQWVGRLTGDVRKTLLTMRWDHGSDRNDASCQERASPVR
jgi:hypothetical protein